VWLVGATFNGDLSSCDYSPAAVVEVGTEMPSSVVPNEGDVVLGETDGDANNPVPNLKGTGSISVENVTAPLIASFVTCINASGSGIQTPPLQFSVTFDMMLPSAVQPFS
jgi:hypothetical protein